MSNEKLFRGEETVFDPNSIGSCLTTISSCVWTGSLGKVVNWEISKEGSKSYDGSYVNGDNPV